MIEKNKRFIGKYGLKRLLLLGILTIFGSFPATINYIFPEINDKIKYLVAVIYIIGAILIYKNLYKNFKLPKSFMENFLVVLTSIILIFIYNTIIDFVSGGFYDTPDNQAFIEQMLDVSFSINLLSYLVVFAPILEEYTFREFLPGLLRKIIRIKNSNRADLACLILANVLFALAHGPKNTYDFSTYFFLGLSLVIIRYKTNNLKLSAISHITWNFISVLILYLSL